MRILFLAASLLILSTSFLSLQAEPWAEPPQYPQAGFDQAVREALSKEPLPAGVDYTGWTANQVFEMQLLQYIKSSHEYFNEALSMAIACRSSWERVIMTTLESKSRERIVKDTKNMVKFYTDFALALTLSTIPVQCLGDETCEFGKNLIGTYSRLQPEKLVECSRMVEQSK
jgi:hypothetical protein